MIGVLGGAELRDMGHYAGAFRKEQVAWRSSSQLCPDGLRLVLSRTFDKACCFILQTTGLRGYLSLVTTVGCPERLLSWF